MKKIFLSVVNFLLALVAIFLTLAVFVQVVMTAALLWIGSAKGQVWLQAQLSERLAESGYTLSLSGLSYHSLQGVVATRFVLGDKDGEILRADRLMAHVDLWPLFHKKADISLKGTNVVLSRLPESKPSAEPETPLEPFSLPDIYITSATVRFSANRLEVKEAVAGQDMVLAPSFDASVDLSQGVIDADASLELVQADMVMAALPENIELKGIFKPQDLSLALEELNVTSSAYDVSAHGTAGLGETAPLNLILQAKSDNLEPLVAQEGSVDLKAVLTGSMDKPLLNADGRASLVKLTEQGLGEIILNISTALENNMPLGQASIQTRYKNLPVKLDADYQYKDPVLHLFAIKGVAPDLALTGALDLDISNLLASGQMDIRLDNLGSYKDLMGVDATGTVTAKLSLITDNDKQGVAGNLKLAKGRYDTISVTSLDVSTLLPDVSVPWPQVLDIKAANLVVSPDTRFNSLSLKLDEAGPSVYRMTIDTQGQARKPFQLKGTGALALVGQKPEASNINLTLTSSGASVAVTGSASEAALDMTAKLQNLTAALIPAELPAPVQSMGVSGEIRLTGTTALPLIGVDIDFSTLKLRGDLPAIKLAATVSYQDSLAKLDVTGTGEGIRTLKAHAEMPLELSLYPFAFALNDSTALTGNADFDLSGTSLLAAILPPDHKFIGDLKGQVVLAGTPAAPQATGTLSINGASYLYQPYGVRLQDLTLEAGLSETQITIQKLSAADGEKGTLSGNGSIHLRNNTQTTLRLKMADYHLLNSHTANGIVGADMSVTGQGEGYVIGGDIRLGEMNIAIPEQFKSTIPELNIITDEKSSGPNATLQSIALNLNVVADNHIFVRGWGLDAEFGGTIAVAGTLDDPQLNGDFSSVRGRYEEFGKRFTLAKSVLRFQGSVPPSPYLDIEATTNAGDVVASVLLTGPVAKPKISFSSVPALPEDEVLSRILFGRNMERITPFQAVQLAQTLRRFSGQGGGGLDPLGEIRSLTGLDDISVDTDEAGETSVGVGKYLTDKVYLEVQKGKSDTSGEASIQIEVTPNVNVESKIGQDAQAGGGIFWKHDY